MKKVKTFFHVFTQSLFPQPRYYRKLHKVGFWFSLKYFIAFIFLLNVLFFAYLYISGGVIRPFKSISFNGIESALGSYPEKLSIEVNNGQLITNSDRPYFIWGQDGEQKTLYGVVSQTATPEQVSEFETPILFTNQGIVFANKNQTAEGVLPYGDAHFTVNKPLVDNILMVYGQVKPFLTAGLLIFIFILAPLFAVFASFLYLVVLAFICYLLFYLVSKKHSYHKTLQISLHAITVPYLTKYGLLAFGYNLDLAWPVFGFLATVFILSGLYESYVDK